MVPGRLLLLLITALLLCPLPLHADGMKFPTRDVEFYPNIPSQRALLVYRDGIEHLTIESTYEGEGASFGWIIPVPNTPTAIAEGSSGAIESISAATPPELAHKVELAAPAAAAAFAAALGVCLVLLAPQRTRWLAACVGLALLAGLCAWVPHHLLRPRADLPPPSTVSPLDVSVEMRVAAGPLDVQVLRAGNPQGLNAWLLENGYKGLPEAGIEIVARYIADGWRFCAAKERRPDVMLSGTRALRISFPTEQPVYPMRLTALGGESMHLKLLTVADFALTTPRLETQRVRRFQSGLAEWGRWLQPGQPDEGFPAMVAGARVIGHPEAVEQMWDGCYVTHLSSKVYRYEMEEDILLTAAGTAESARTYWTYEAERLRGRKYGYLSMPLVLLGVLLWLYRPRHSHAQRMRAAFIALLAAGLAAYPVAGLTRVFTRSVQVEEAPDEWGLQAAITLEALRGGEPKWPLEYVFPGGPKGLELDEAVLQVLEETGYEEAGDGPLEYQLWRDGGELWVRLYDINGLPKEINMGRELPQEE